MPPQTARPFYSDYAWAYSLLVEAPLSRRCDFICDRLSREGILPGAHLLDAGCGPGHYSIELARRGYSVTGLDASPHFIAEAQGQPEASALPVTFIVGDIRTLPPSLQVDGILCRGVLNDLTEDAECLWAISSFAGALRQGGLLLFDVRDWQATSARKAREPVTRKIVQTDRGLLTFHSVTQLDESSHRLFITERHTLAGLRGEQSADYQFVMRCWTEDEVRRRLDLAGFIPLSLLGGYDEGSPLGSTDRIVCIACRTAADASRDPDG